MRKLCGTLNLKKKKAVRGILLNKKRILI